MIWNHSIWDRNWNVKKSNHLTYGMRFNLHQSGLFKRDEHRRFIPQGNLKRSSYLINISRRHGDCDLTFEHRRPVPSRFSGSMVYARKKHRYLDNSKAIVACISKKRRSSDGVLMAYWS